MEAAPITVREFTLAPGEPSLPTEAAGLHSNQSHGEEMILNMGPQHPSTHGVLRLELRTDGEIVTHVTPHLGYLHRCKEKIGENLPYYQYIGYTDRLDYLAAMNNNLAWSMAVEQLAGISVPRRAEFVRVIAVELNRIASHLVSFGTYGLDLGAFTPFLYAFREREYILDLFEQMCGARLTLSYINIGGVTWDLPAGFTDKLIEFLDYFEPKLIEYDKLLTRNPIFVKRTANLGLVSKQQCIDWALSGPMIRGSGIPNDLRRDRPYTVYPELDFDVIVGRGEMGELGDCWDRYWVKMAEMAECCKILRQCVAMLPDGPFRAKIPASHESAGRRSLCRSRKPPRPSRLLHRKPGRPDPLPRENSRAELRESRRPA